MVYVSADVPNEILTPCLPNPCGSNAACREQNGIGACQCLPEYFGNPYEGCRPECVHNSDCQSNLACIRNKCQDPCPGTCGQNADCRVVNHIPSCSCRIDYIGDPYRFCNVESKIIFYNCSIYALTNSLLRELKKKISSA